MVSRAPVRDTQRAQRADIDTVSLASELRGAIRGEVRFDDGSRALYATDSSNYRQVPLGLVLPRDKEDVVATLAACRRVGAPVLTLRRGEVIFRDGTVTGRRGSGRYLAGVAQEPTAVEAGRAPGLAFRPVAAT